MGWIQSRPIYSVGSFFNLTMITSHNCIMFDVAVELVLTECVLVRLLSQEPMCADMYWCFACPKQTHGPDGAPFGPERHTCASL